MHRLRNLCAAIALASILVSLSACGVSNAQRERKREEDRMAIHLTEAQRQLDQTRAQLEKAQSALADEQGRNAVVQQQLAGLRGQLKDAQDTLDTERAARAAEKSTVEKRLLQAGVANAQTQARIERLVRENAALKLKLAALKPATQPATTLPENPLNK